MQKDYIFLNVPGLLARKEIPPTGYWKRIVIAYTYAEIDFLIASNLLKPDAEAALADFREAVVKFSDLTDEGQDFLRTGALNKWLGACDRKSNDLGKRNATEEEQLAVYADASGLFKRLAKFRSDRVAIAN